MLDHHTNISELIKQKRETLGLNQREFSEFIGLNDGGERTIGGWERGEHMPTPAKLERIQNIKSTPPFQDLRTTYPFSFIDLFAGIGGIRLGFQLNHGKCVFTSEWDKFSKKTYAANFGELPHGDITKIESQTIPKHDVLLAGFPCQAFSQAGLKRGFNDTRGTMFFEIQRILAHHQPKAFLLENVKQLKGHDQGRTLETILEILRGKFTATIPEDVELSDETRKSLNTKLNYNVDFRVLKASDFGVPQNRERVYILGFNKDKVPACNTSDVAKEIFDRLSEVKLQSSLFDALQSNAIVDPKYTLSERLWNGHKRRKEQHKLRGNGFGYSLFSPNDKACNTISARYYKDGSEILIDQSDINQNPRKLTPLECAKIQGFPSKFILDAVSDTQYYRQFGNSVTVPVIEAIAKEMLPLL